VVTWVKADLVSPAPVPQAGATGGRHRRAPQAGARMPGARMPGARMPGASKPGSNRAGVFALPGRFIPSHGRGSSGSAALWSLAMRKPDRRAAGAAGAAGDAGDAGAAGDRGALG
jgi:hypothetical protein